MLGKHYLCAVVTQEEVNWLTPQSGDVTGSTREAVAMWANGQRPKTSDQRLRTQVAAEQLKHGPADPASSNTSGSRQGLSWATPKTPTGGPETAKRKQELGRTASGGGDLASQANGKLNPRWVETLMGLPIGWTMPSCTSPQTIAPMSCDCLAMESCPPPQSGLSES